jgi:Ca2+-binding RTX toxin-like protein
LGGDGLGGGGDIDKLFGGSGSDTITGGNANDILIGGYGADNLSGSNGADTFFYLGQKDTGDTISGFSQAEGDRIKFDSAFGFDSSDFMGSISTPGAVDAGKFGYRYDPLTNTTTVYVDTDGVFGADMEIKLSGNVALTSGDFLFGGI